MQEQIQQRLLKSSQRWFPIPERVQQHKEISRYRFEKKRYKVAHAGRRSFKTEIAKRTIVSEAMKREGQRLFASAPTRDQAKRIYWDDLKKLADPVIKDKSESELYIETITGSKIWVLGMDVPARFEGSPWNGGVVDEFGNMKEGILEENILPAIADTKGWLWLVGVPEGRNQYFDLVQNVKNDPINFSEWGIYHWLSKDAMDPIEVERMRSIYDERTFRQEYEGSFESYEGRAYVYYDALIHRKQQVFDKNYPLWFSLDFNLDPCLWLIGQDRNGFISVQDEIKQRQTDIWKMCAELKRRIEYLLGDRQYKHKLLFYGDFEHGQARSVSATSSSWQILRDEFGKYNAEFRLKGHPRIIDRVNSVNSRLRSADGSVNVGIDPRCIELSKDLETVSMDMLTASKGTAGDRTHASDDLGYMINYEYPVTGRSIIHIR
jgi:hypothetical protein